MRRVLSDVLGIVATVLAVEWLTSGPRRPELRAAQVASCPACDPDRLWHGGQEVAA